MLGVVGKACSRMTASWCSYIYTAHCHGYNHLGMISSAYSIEILETYYSELLYDRNPQLINLRDLCLDVPSILSAAVFHRQREHGLGMKAASLLHEHERYSEGS